MATKPTIKQEITTLRAAFEREQQEAKAAFEKKLADMLVNVKNSVLHSLKEAHNFFEGLDKAEKESILKDAEITDIFGSFTAHKSVLQSLQDAYARFETLDKVGKDMVRSNADIKAILGSFGYVKRKPTDSTSAESADAGDNKPATQYDKAAILAFLGDTGKLQLEVEKHFHTTKTSVIQWGKNLVKDNAITIGKAEGNRRSNFWKPV